MFKQKTKKVLQLALAVSMVASTLIACSSNSGNTNAGASTGSSSSSIDTSGAQPASAPEAPLETIELTMAILGGTPSQLESVANNQNDIVTAEIEKKFNVKIKEIRVAPTDQSAKQIYSLYNAAGNLPDIMVGDKNFTSVWASTGQFLDMTEYLDQMPNYTSKTPDSIWNRYLVDGKHYLLPHPAARSDDPKAADNPFVHGYNHWTPWVREDILAQLGYKFTPLQQLKTEYYDKGLYAPEEALKIEPAIDTPEKFTELLQKVKDLDLKVGGKPVIPFSSIWWSVFHFSSLMGNGHWEVNDAGDANGWITGPNAKAYFKYWSDLYQAGLLDKDYITQKDDQLQEKIASGRIAAGLYIPDANGARKANLERDPTADLRPIPWPKTDDSSGFYDVLEAGYWTMVINKDTKDINRIVQIIDYLNSDEGMDLLTWGPESAGIWEIKDGKKVFKAEYEQAIRDNAPDGKNAAYYGIWDPFAGSFASKVALLFPVGGVNNSDWRLSYPTVIDPYNGANQEYSMKKQEGYNVDGRATSGDGGENTTLFTNWYWNFFAQKEIATLLTAKSEEAFDKAWDKVLESAEKNGNMSAAKADMVKWFQTYGPK